MRLVMVRRARVARLPDARALVCMEQGRPHARRAGTAWAPAAASNAARAARGTHPAPPGLMCCSPHLHLERRLGGGGVRLVHEVDKGVGPAGEYAHRLDGAKGVEDAGEHFGVGNHHLRAGGRGAAVLSFLPGRDKRQGSGSAQHVEPSLAISRTARPVKSPHIAQPKVAADQGRRRRRRRPGDGGSKGRGAPADAPKRRLSTTGSAACRREQRGQAAGPLVRFATRHGGKGPAAAVAA